MSEQLRTVLLLISVMLVGAQLGSAKCISSRITVESEIIGVTNGLAVKVDVRSKTKGDPVTHVSQEYSIDRAYFRVVAWFNTTSNVIQKETCDRYPARVIVKLMKGKLVLDHKTLSVETDFRATWDGDYEPLIQVTLDAHSIK